jgi:RNA polymerase sigma-70 factor (ECF subfamily)
VNIFKKLSTFRFDSSLKTWIYRITSNISINYLKKKIKQEKNHVSYDDALEKKQITEPADPRSFEPGQEEVINSLLDMLNPDQRACIVLRNMEGLSYQEIAESLNININTVRSRLKRARTILLAKKTEVIRQ